MGQSNNRSAFVRQIAVVALVIWALRTLDSEILFTQVFQLPLIISPQYIAAGLLGEAAYAGGMGTALLGMVLHYVNAFIIAAVFFLAAERLPVLARYPIPAGMVYGFGVWVVMTFVVIPNSAIPPSEPPPSFVAIWLIVTHMLTVGLPVGITLKRNAAASA